MSFKSNRALSKSTFDSPNLYRVFQKPPSTFKLLNLDQNYAPLSPARVAQLLYCPICKFKAKFFSQLMTHLIRGNSRACADLIEQKSRDKNGKEKDGGSFNIAKALCEVLPLIFYI